jgi:hypothetical protein
MKLKIRNTPTKRNPKRFEVVELKLEPELAALIEAFAAEKQMSPESFGSMVVDQYQAKQN